MRPGLESLYRRPCCICHNRHAGYVPVSYIALDNELMNVLKSFGNRDSRKTNTETETHNWHWHRRAKKPTVFEKRRKANRKPTSARKTDTDPALALYRSGHECGSDWVTRLRFPMGLPTVYRYIYTPWVYPWLWIYPMLGSEPISAWVVYIWQLGSNGFHSDDAQDEARESKTLQPTLSLTGGYCFVTVAHLLYP
jgi:hypothetical protein